MLRDALARKKSLRGGELGRSGSTGGKLSMNHVTVRKGALAALSAMLLGCASAPVVNDATVLSDTRQKGKDDASVASRPPGVPTNIDGAVKQAQVQRKNGDFQAAAHTLSQLVLLAPDDARVVGEYGKTLIAMGRTDDALAFLERAGELQPRDWSLFSAQGVAYDQKGEYLAAQAAYGRALVLKPGEPTVLSNAALSHVQTGDLDGAEALLLQASPLGAEFPRIASNLALVRSLKNSRFQQAASIGPTKESVTGPAPTEAAIAPVTPLAVVPMPETSESEISAAPQIANLAEMPAGQIGDSAATSGALARSQIDPSVRMQPLPARDPEPAVKPKPKNAGTRSNIAKGEPDIHMRPTPDDDQPNAIRPPMRNAKNPASPVALDGRASSSDPLALRPAPA